MRLPWFSGTQGKSWPLFGSANQLLASLTLLAVTVWLSKAGKKNGFVRYPMYFMFCVAISALCFMVYNNALEKNYPLVVVSLILLAVAITLVINALTSLKKVAVA